MSFTSLAALVFGGILVAIYYAQEMRFFQVFIAILFGFYLADSDLAPQIEKAVKASFDWVGTWDI